MSRQDWIFQGVPAHFIGAQRCGFRLSTVIGPYVISTVGDWVPLGEMKILEIGNDRLYETMVFKSQLCECGCGFHVADVSEELEYVPFTVFRGYKKALEAQEGHYEICEEVDRYCSGGVK